MRKLSDGTNVDAADADYLKGRVRDKVGATPGTVYNEVLHGDVIEFFQKLIVDASIVENDLPDNVTNGHQLIQALDFRFERTREVQIGIWDMVALSQVRFNLPADIDPLKISSIIAMIYDDDTIASSGVQSIKTLETGISSGEMIGAVSLANLAAQWEVVLNRWPGFAGGFDTTEYDNSTDNRGIVTIKYHE